MLESQIYMWKQSTIKPDYGKISFYFIWSFIGEENPSKLLLRKLLTFFMIWNCIDNNMLYMFVSHNW
jgi:hypothetical protein